MEVNEKINSSGGYHVTDILIDTGSTMSIFNNPIMLLNIRKSKKTMRAYSSGGHQDSNQVGDFPGLFTVWYKTFYIEHTVIQRYEEEIPHHNGH